MMAESEVKKCSDNHLIVRSNFFGWGTSLKESFSDFIINNIKNKKEITLFTDVYYSPVSIGVLIDIIKN